MDRPWFEPRNPAAFEEMVEFGAYGDGIHEADAFRRWRKAIRESGSSNAVFVDTTLVHTVDRLLRGDDTIGLNPAALLDLANGVSALVLADTVFCLENPTQSDPAALNELLGVGPAFVPVPTTSWGAQVNARVRGMFLVAMDYAEKIGSGGRFAADAEQIKSAWETLLGAKLDWSTWTDQAVRYRNDAYGELSNASEFYKAAMSLFRRGLPTQPGAERDKIDQFILESNLRSAFNQSFAYGLEIDYIPNVFRMPFQNYMLSKGFGERQHFLRFLDEKSRKHVEEIYGTEREFRLPLFLSAILAKSQTPKDVRELIADWRLRAEGFRSRRRELNEAVARQDTKEGGRMLSALENEEGPGLLKVALALTGVAAVGAAAAIIPTIQAASPGVMMALHGAAEVMVPSAIIAGSGLTAFKARSRVLVRAAQASAALGDARRKIQSIWKTGPVGQDYADWLTRAAQLG